VQAGRRAAERNGAAGQIHPLLELALLAGDHRHVIERLGIFRVLAQDLGIALHRHRDFALTVVEEALLQQLGDGPVAAVAGLLVDVLSAHDPASIGLWRRCQAFHRHPREMPFAAHQSR
jgi:hypothetical protein